MRLYTGFEGKATKDEGRTTKENPYHEGHEEHEEKLMNQRG
jgi:hypothetical protein